MPTFSSDYKLQTVKLCTKAELVAEENIIASIFLNDDLLPIFCQQPGGLLLMKHKSYNHYKAQITFQRMFNPAWWNQFRAILVKTLVPVPVWRRCFSTANPFEGFLLCLNIAVSISIKFRSTFSVIACLWACSDLLLISSNFWYWFHILEVTLRENPKASASMDQQIANL